MRLADMGGEDVRQLADAPINKLEYESCLASSSMHHLDMPDELKGQEKEWVERWLATYPKTMTAKQRAKVVASLRKSWPYSGGPNLSKLELEILGLDDLAN